jgi:hypothetical protein
LFALEFFSKPQAGSEPGKRGGWFARWLDPGSSFWWFDLVMQTL